MNAERYVGRLKSLVKRGIRLVNRNGEVKNYQQKIAEKNQRIGSLRRQVEKRDREIASLRSGAGGDAVAVRPGDSMPVFFIVGFAKSGTSWLMRTLNGHPEIFCTGEGLFFGRGTDLDKRKGTVAPSSLYGVFADSEYLRKWIEKSAWSRDDGVDEHVTNLTRVAGDYFMGRKVVGTNKRIVGDKTPFVTEECIREISMIYPEAKVIHIIRDGRDVAVSAVHHMWNHSSDAGGHLDSVQAEELAKRDAYRKNPEVFFESGQSIFNEGRFRSGFVEPWRSLTASAVEEGPALLGENYSEVRYEDLLENPGREIARILEFLGADSGERAVSKSIEAGSFEKWSKGRERGQEDSSSFFRKGVSGDWRNAFTEKDKSIFKEMAGDLLIELGYEKDDYW